MTGTDKEGVTLEQLLSMASPGPGDAEQDPGKRAAINTEHNVQRLREQGRLRAKLVAQKFDISTAEGILTAAAVALKVQEPYEKPLGFLRHLLVDEGELLQEFGGKNNTPLKRKVTPAQAAKSLAFRGPFLWHQFAVALNEDQTAVAFGRYTASVYQRWATWADLQAAINDEQSILTPLLEARAKYNQHRKDNVALIKKQRAQGQEKAAYLDLELERRVAEAAAKEAAQQTRTRSMRAREAWRHKKAKAQI